MVLLRIKSLSEVGDRALVEVSKMKSMRLAKIRVVQESPMVVHIEYGKNLERFLRIDASLKYFAVQRGLQMADETMGKFGASKDDFTAEVIIGG